MTTNKVYEEIIASMPVGLEREVMTVLVNHVGRRNRITRNALILAVYGRSLRSWKDSTEDRQIRHAIASLQDQGYPVLSDSGSGGYYLPANEQERDQYIAELESRRDRLNEKIRSLRLAKKTAWSEPAKYVQQNLIGG